MKFKRMFALLLLAMGLIVANAAEAKERPFKLKEFAGALHNQVAAESNRAVVIVSGGAAISPYTTPHKACMTGYAAGNTDDFMRSYLLNKGLRVFTSPAMTGRGKVVEQSGDGGPFANCPTALPDHMTVNSVGDIELAGVHLANFVNYLGRVYGIKQVDFLGNSMGGLFSRSAIQYLQKTRSTVKVRSLTTLGTPWEGAPFANSKDPANPLSACDGFLICEEVLAVFGAYAPIILVETKTPEMIALNNYSADVLKTIPVTLVGGDAFTKSGGDSAIWPNDGIVNLSSALAQDVPNSVINHRRCYLFEGGTHSIYISNLASLPEDSSITWNNTVGSWVYRAIQEAGSALSQPNRQGCPAPKI